MGMKNKSQTIGVLAQVGSCMLFGFSVLATKLGTEAYSMFTLLSWRFVLSALVMNLMRAGGLMKIRLRGKRVLPLLCMALLQPVLYFVCETYGVTLVSAAECGALYALIPVVTLTLSILLLGDRPRKLQKLGIVISVTGVALISAVKWEGAAFSPLGYGLILTAIVSDSLFVILSSRLKDFSSAEKTYVMSMMGAVVFTLCALAEHGFTNTLPELLLAPLASPQFLFSVLFLGIGCQICAFFLVNFAISRLGATRATSFVGLSVLVSVASGVVFLAEEFSMAQGAGTTLVLLGVYLSNREVSDR